MGNSIYDERAVLNGRWSYADTYADAWALQSGANSNVPYRVDSIIACSTSIAAQILDVGIAFDGQTPGPLFRIGSALIPAGAGDGTVPVVDVLLAVLPPGVVGLVLQAGQFIVSHLQATPGSGELVIVNWFGGEL